VVVSGVSSARFELIFGEVSLALNLSSLFVGFDVSNALQVGVETERDGECAELHHEIPEVDEVRLRDLVGVLQVVITVV